MERDIVEASAKKGILVNNDEYSRFSQALTRFLEQACMQGEQYTIKDELLFAHFRDFWSQASEYFDHPALLGYFRVELIGRGFHSKPHGKKPVWHGLTLIPDTNP